MDWAHIFLGTGFEPHIVHFYDTPLLLWVLVSSDTLIALAYFSISAGILYFMFKRKETEYKGLYPIFAGFIFLCGVTHTLHIITLWYPVYILQAVADICTAVVSLGASAIVWYVMPQALRIPSSTEYAESQRTVELKEHEIQIQRIKDERRKDFVSMMGHELKTPITSQLLFVEMLHRQAREDGLETYADHLETMRRQSHKLTKLVNDMLEVIRVDGGKIRFNFGYTDLWAVVHEAVQESNAVASHHRIRIKGSSRRKVWADHDRMVQVMSNLIINAIKYSPDADHVIVRVLEKEKGAMVRVEDFGIGIDKEHQQRIFDQFYRVTDETGDTQVTGMGVGLYISSEIMKRHGGRIWVESEVGKGSTFCFTLPYHPDAKPESGDVLTI